MSPNLSFEQAPPLDVPLRFFVTACLFGIAAGGVFAFAGDALGTRWSGPSLALTHLITAGLMLQVMIGSLLQLMPVVIGVNLWRPRLTASWVHVLSTLGAVALSLAFLSARPVLYGVAGALLAAATLPFATLVVTVLLRSRVGGDTPKALRVAALCLIATVVLGLLLAASRAGGASAQWLTLTPLHIRLGWLGWGLVLLAGVSYQVVPMFQLTPAYPERFRRAFVSALLLVLLLGGLATLQPRLHLVAGALESIAVLAFVATTALVRRRGRRKRMDPSFLFWRVTLVSMSVAALLHVGALIAPPSPAAQVSLGVLVMLGAFASVMIGMLYKIVPFLVWLHLQRRGVKPLLMHQVIGEGAMRHHLLLHVAALALCTATPWLTGLAPLAGALVIAAFSTLLFNLVRALLRYRRGCRQPPMAGRLQAG